MDPLRFGDPGGWTDGTGRTTSPTLQRHLVDGVVRGVGGYGNCVGVPNIGGEVVFDDTYAGNPLVNVLAIGVLDRDRLQLARAEAPATSPSCSAPRPGATASAARRARQPGVRRGARRQAPQRAGRRPVRREAADRVLPRAVRARPGVRASRTWARPASPARPRSSPRGVAGHGRRPRPGPPARAVDGVLGDPLLGVAGAHARAGRPDSSTRCSRSPQRWGVPASVIGEVVEGDALRADPHGEVIADLPARSLADEGPVYDRPRSARLARRLRRGRRGVARRSGGTLEARRRRRRHDLDAFALGSSPRRTSPPSAGSPSSTTSTCSGTVLGPGWATPGWCGCPAQPPGGRLRDRRQRPLVRARPGRGHPPGRRRGVPQRRLHRRPAAGDHQLPQLRQPGAAGDHVAARRVDRGAGRGCRRSACRSPAATSRSTTRPRARPSTRPR
jgi:hypothetical protein